MTELTDIPTITVMHVLVDVFPVHSKDVTNAKKITTSMPTISTVTLAGLAVQETVTVTTHVMFVPRVTTSMPLMDTVMPALLTVQVVKPALPVMNVNLVTGCTLMV